MPYLKLRMASKVKTMVGTEEIKLFCDSSRPEETEY